MAKRKKIAWLIRFWSKVKKTASCWEWTAALHGSGYGIFCIEGSKTERAHRISFRICKGPIPDDLFVLHRCDNRKCVNPDHLFLGTNDDNVRDMIAKGRNAPPPPMGGWNKFSYDDAIIAKLGTIPDTVIAAELGVSKHAIQRERRRRNIPAIPSQTRFRKGAPHPRWSRRKEVKHAGSPGT